MAHRNSGNNGNGGKMRVRYVEFEIEGGDPVLQESVRAITSVVNSNRKSVVAQIRPLQQKPVESGVQEELNFGGNEETETPDETEVTEAGTQEPRVARGSRDYRTLKVVDLALPSGAATFEAYIKDYRKPTNVRDRYVIALGYLLCIGHNEATTDQVYTCFREVSWPVTKDFSQPLRDLRRAQLARKGTKVGTFVLNHLGIAAVEKLKKDE